MSGTGDAPPWCVRVLDGRGLVVGTGFLIANDLVLTCAHVVAGTGAAGRPADEVRVELPAFGQDRAARVLPGGWFPASSGRGDLAVLSLIGPSVRCDPLPAVRPDEDIPVGLRVRYFGYPGDAEQGMWMSARVSAGGGAGTGRRTLDSSGLHGLGFSGAAVLSGETGNVVGVLAAAGPERAAVMLTARSVAELWPPVAGLAAKAAGAQRLSVAETGTILDALMNMPDLAELRLRALYDELLGVRLGERPGIGVRAETRLELWTLVTWCAERPGAFHALLDAVRTFHPASVEVEQLAERIERVVPPPLLTDAERTDLLRLVEAARVEPAELLRAAPVGARDGGDLPSAVRTLEDAVISPDGVPPLLEFVARLAEEAEPGARTELRSWLGGVAGRLGLPPREWAATRPDPPPRTPFYLIVQLEEDGLDADRYLLAVSAQRPGQPPTVLLSPDDAVTVPEIQRLLTELVGTVGTPTRDADDLVIEFVLPRELLNVAVDEWRLEPADAAAGAAADAEPEVSIGAVYPVVVRSLERLRTSRAGRPGWNRPDRPTALDHPDRAAVPGGVYLADDGPDGVFAALHAGVPFVVWHRDGLDPAAAAELQSRLAETPADELPRMVRDLRREAATAPDDADHWGKGLQLLFDDPSRVPDRPGGLHLPERSEGETSR